MKKVCTAVAVTMLCLLSFAFLVSPAVADWHGGEALVMYKMGSDGWVQHNYKDGSTWNKFRAEFVDQGWSVDFAKHIDVAKLSNYDALFVLTPRENIPGDEAQAIINWVMEGGQLVIGQSDGGIDPYANEITETFGIIFDKSVEMKITDFATHILTTTPNELEEVEGASKARNISVTGASREIGFDAKGRCLLAVNESAGKGVVVAIGDEWMWSWSMKYKKFDKADNEELMDNILAYFKQTCSVPEFTTLTFTIPVFALLSVVFLLLRRRK